MAAAVVVQPEAVCHHKSDGGMSEQPDRTTLSPGEAAALVEKAFVFGMPLVYVAVQIEMASNVAKPGPGRAPLNQIGHPPAAC